MPAYYTNNGDHDEILHITQTMMIMMNACIIHKAMVIMMDAAEIPRGAAGRVSVWEG